MKAISTPATVPTPAPAAALDPLAAPISRLVEVLQDEEQTPMPLTHHFAPGTYTREILMPAGTFVIGHVHKTEHHNIVLTGRATVLMLGEKQEITAPCVFKSGVGVRKMLLIHEDMRWLTVHPNPDNCTDIAALEERLLELDPAFLAEKGALSVDEFRMSRNPPTTLEENHP